jgi:hypothetical protein
MTVVARRKKIFFSDKINESEPLTRVSNITLPGTEPVQPPHSVGTANCIEFQSLQSMGPDHNYDDEAAIC